MTPTRSLVDPNPLTQHRYVPSHQQETQGILALWLADHAKPYTAESYARDQVAEHASMQIRSYRK